MSVKFTAPPITSNRLDVSMIPTGMHLCTFYGLADLGTQETNFGSKAQVNLAFEFPKEMRVFWEGDQAKPSCIFSTETFSMGNKANLRVRYIEQMIGKKLTDDEANNFDLSQLLGKNFVATIQHSPDGKYANIISLTPLNDSNKQLFSLATPHAEQINPTYFFHVSHGYNSANFSALPKFVRNKIIESTEGKAYAQTGGTFAEPPKKDNTAPSGAAPKIVMSPTAEHSYEQYKSSNWSDEQLVAHGLASYQQAVSPPVTNTVPSPQAAPSGPPMPGAPASIPPPIAAQPPVPSTPVIIMNPGEAPAEEYRALGWTDQQLVENGKATFQ